MLLARQGPLPLTTPHRGPDWDALIAEHDRRVLLTLLARGVRIDRARDITQETWARLIAHQRAGRILHVELPGLALRQAFFLLGDELRRGRRDAAVTDEELRAISDPAPNVLDRLVSRSQLEVASAELDRCSPKAREVFELVYADEAITHAEAAKRVGLSVQRVRQTLCEVRARLRAALADKPVDTNFSRATEVSDD
ncbi:MAG: sigma-70 family RNA polymerase sigma factor [Labilithrix sp.]|nr:sigma-70 family RNA polymerase sigma factor [Labilithrix sp.]MCW5816516.1 sigma-70 family RNA polymerase sigma factor [Labilithrix sp.]